MSRDAVARGKATDLGARGCAARPLPGPPLSPAAKREGAPCGPAPPSPPPAQQGEAGRGWLGEATAPAPEYTELHCLSNFSFQRGASSAQELFARAKQLGYTALAITDECSLAGIVRAYEASQESGVPLIVGSEFALADGPKLVLLVEDAAGYSNLCRLVTKARRRSAKGEYCIGRADFEGGCGGLLALWVPGADPDDETAAWLQQRFSGRAWLAVELHRGPDDAARLAQLLGFARRHALPCVAAGDVHMHVRARRALQDVLTAIRVSRPVDQCGFALFPNGERHLRRRDVLARIHPPALMDESVRIARRCRFSLGELKYEYPHELVPAGTTPAQHLRALTLEGAARRWPGGIPDEVQALIERELALVAELGYEAFFLTVQDVVAFARSRGILCQGRGSAANSVVCYCLGITAVAPEMIGMLFERFISKERNEPPDIDVDFEHERREEVIQYVYGKYGRERAALAATVICYRPRSAARDIGRALGLSEDQLGELARVFAWGNDGAPVEQRLRERGLDPRGRTMRQLLALVDQLVGFPRHLSQHVGGFVISEQPLHHLVPVENAAMEERTIIQWDKDDLETLGLLKVDCLALGMLSCIRRCLDLLRAHGGADLELATIPKEDPTTYAMIQRADTLGVFQIESRAQMAMLPRLKPADFYDLVIEVAIVRPGPIQGKMVHPYLRRRQGLEPVEFPSPQLRKVFGRTLGVPIFQEQVMHLAMVAAGFSAGEADRLRRSMAAWKRRGGLEHWRERILSGMGARGYSLEFAEQIFEQIKGFGSYGFPESHAASFALLVYASAWLKCHHPAAFACALLNSQPMGFYAPAQIVSDARRHGVEVRPVDVVRSGWECSLEPVGTRAPGSRLSLRLGLRQVEGIGEDCAQRIVAARGQQAFEDVGDLVRRARLDRHERERLAAAGALRPLAGHRHRAYWAVAGSDGGDDLAASAPPREARVALRPPSLADEVHADYATTGLSLACHPVALVRRQLAHRRARRAAEIDMLQHGAWTRYAGLVTVRQRPGTASGVTFLTLEDETGHVNVVVWRDLAVRQRRELVEAVLLGVEGRMECADGVRHLVAKRLIDYSALLPQLDSQSRDFH